MAAVTSLSFCASPKFVSCCTLKGERQNLSQSASFTGSGRKELSASVSVTRNGTASRSVVRMGNKHTSGPFSPIVVIVRNFMGVKPFNQFRGKGIALHSQVITEFCKSIGADAKQRQGLIRLAKKNGEKLGFLA